MRCEVPNKKKMLAFSKSSIDSKEFQQFIESIRAWNKTNEATVATLPCFSNSIEAKRAFVGDTIGFLRNWLTMTTTAPTMPQDTTELSSSIGKSSLR